jgi:hypothetical protein
MLQLVQSALNHYQPTEFRFFEAGGLASSWKYVTKLKVKQ